VVGGAFIVPTKGSQQEEKKNKKAEQRKSANKPQGKGKHLKEKSKTSLRKTHGGGRGDRHMWGEHD